MLRIFGIGGGELGRHETLELDRAMVASTGRPRPRVLFVPTASFDASSYTRTFSEIYGGMLGCEVDALHLVEDPPDDRELRHRVEAADLVYVGGGNTRFMLASWRRRGLDRLLVEAAGRGTVLGGLSAGAICWFRRAHSHADRVPHPQGDGCLEGLGLLEGTAAPHFGQQAWRIGILRSRLDYAGGVGIGLDDHLALQVEGDRYRVLACRGDRSLYRIRRGAEGLVGERFSHHEDWRPLGELLEEA